ncbi:hypothetical protein G4G28_22535 [Massilia sp. Dwa41.01b]|uniref:hypothetical protein n=1 Tax=unclassified Massilia TaxID=2609279 RepID=UPI00160492D8|nr:MULTISPECIES: hypothetical protein [unclassified Massilia]QNA90585.1 hypothetical protein G4G28_22535 [Massilia sp. Dwa41.01b]QNA97816.1 hypothetical protein G4G31_01615 [Massilia sp. Se16.2.3]
MTLHAGAFCVEIIANMKTLFALVLILSCSACTEQPINARGVYRFDTPERTMILDLRASGEYVLQIDGVGRNTDEIRGRWDAARGSGSHIAFYGLVWHGTEPEAGQGIWAARVARNADICLDAEGVSCFAKDDGV